MSDIPGKVGSIWGRCLYCLMLCNDYSHYWFWYFMGN